MGISCEDVWKAISDYIDENLDAVDRRLLNQRLAQRRQCTAVLDEMPNLIRLYRYERVFVLPDGFHGPLEQRLREKTAPKPGRGFETSIPVGYPFPVKLITAMSTGA
jgi:hypothetical protein